MTIESGGTLAGPQRYEWEDALIAAERDGKLRSGAVVMCLRLASAINWNPKKTENRPGLYWKNETALKHVGSSRATYHRHRLELVQLGFLQTIGGNLIPTLPEKSQVETVAPAEKSQVETVVSQDETELSQVETEKSQNEHPLSVDTFTEDSFPEDPFTARPTGNAWSQATPAPAPGSAAAKELVERLREQRREESREGVPTIATSRTPPFSKPSDLQPSGEVS